MMKVLKVFTVFMMLVLLSAGNIAFSESSVARKKMQEHIEKMKRLKPVKYQVMVREAGGNIYSCVSCHKNIIKPKQKSPSGQ